MDFLQSPEHRDLRAAVASIAGHFGGAYYVEHAESGTPTTELWAQMGKAGFIGVNVPAEYGGGGGGLVELAIVCEELGAAGCPLLLLVVSAAISVEVIAKYGSPEMREEFLSGLATGERKIVFAITEPDAGSNSRNISTTAQRVSGVGEGDHWVLRGTKYYISGIDEADQVLVVARTGTDASGQGLLSLFLVDTDAPGLTANALPVGIRLPDKQFTLFFDDVRVPASRLIGVEHEGFKQVFHGLNPERITGAALCVGVGRYALDKAARYANERSVWGRPIGAHQGVAHPLAAAKVEVELAGLMTAKAAWLHDAGLPAGSCANMAKYAAAEAGLAAVDAAIQTHGGNGFSTEFGLIPYWGMARLLRVAPVNREMILNHVAQHDLGLPKSY
ncbi:MAG TPA: acyl-CoA dehydrogenase family protein [Sporichthyaceae bacterium]|jgi:alkylation response protein AidB-like acyl-CoA dehydrogenase|nr:acyl-CoA dehydrogenase family protein [Sporichthyaceae bacterium]